MATYRTTPTDNLTNAIETLAAGDTLVVGSGEYAQNVSASPAEGVTIQFEPGALVRGLFWLSGANGLALLNPRVTWRDGISGSNHMVKFSGGTGLKVIGGELWDAKSFAALLLSGGITGFDIGGLHIHDTYPTNGTNQDHLIYANGASDGRIHHCLLTGAANGRGIKLGTQGSYNGPARIEVDHCTIVDTKGPSNIQLSYRAQDCRIHHNIFDGSSAENVTDYSPTFPGNNIVSDNVGWNSPKDRVLTPNGTYLQDGGGNIYADPTGYRSTHGHLAGVTPQPEPEPEPAPNPCEALQAQIATLTAELAATDAALVTMAAARDALHAELSRYTLVTEPVYRRG